MAGATAEYREVLEAYRMFAHDKGWLRRLNESVQSGVVAEVAVERVQSEARSRMERAANPYLRDRLGIGACGDWCGGPRVEGAYYSACRRKCYPILGFLLRGVGAARVAA